MLSRHDFWVCVSKLNAIFTFIVIWLVFPFPISPYHIIGRLTHSSSTRLHTAQGIIAPIPLLPAGVSYVLLCVRIDPAILTFLCMTNLCIQISDPEGVYRAVMATCVEQVDLKK